MGTDQDSDVEKENDKIRRLQLMVHLTINLLHQPSTSLSEAINHVEQVRKFALALFPGKERAWEMIYQPKFNRILRQRWGYVTEKPEGMVS